jgi:hypothetical protein
MFFLFDLDINIIKVCIPEHVTLTILWEGMEWPLYTDSK